MNKSNIMNPKFKIHQYVWVILTHFNFDIHKWYYDIEKYRITEINYCKNNNNEIIEHINKYNEHSILPERKFNPKNIKIWYTVSNKYDEFSVEENKCFKQYTDAFIQCMILNKKLLKFI